MNALTTFLFRLAVALALAMPTAWAQGDIQINGQPLDEAQRRTLDAVQRRTGPWPAGAYWYDARTGVVGRWGGPVAAFLLPGLALAGPMPAQASGGGDGRLTGVFINGRELHPLDVAALRLLGPVIPGRYSWDAYGNVSTEGGLWLFNFYALLRARNPPPDPGTPRGGTSVGDHCARVPGRLHASDSSSGYVAFVGCQ